VGKRPRRGVDHSLHL